MVEYSAGIVTAYGSAKRAGYTGTYEDFCRQQAQYAQNASAVEQAKQTAVSASQSADQAKQDAQTASTTAQSASQSAQGSAQSAGQSAQDAQTAKNNAQTYAQSASQSAGSAQQSAQSAQAVLESIPEDYSDLSSDVVQLKADLGECFSGEALVASSSVLDDFDNALTNRYYSINATDIPHSPVTEKGHLLCFGLNGGSSETLSGRKTQIFMSNNGKIYFRLVQFSSGAPWTDWSELPDKNYVSKCFSGEALVASSSVLDDFDNALTNRYYSINATDIPHSPVTEKGHLLCFGLNGGSSETLSGRKTQIFISKDLEMYCRIVYFSSGAPWSDWIKINAEKEHFSPSVSMFKTIGIIGDSFASGEIYNSETGTHEDYYDLSWGQVLARKCGIKVVNYSVGGLSTKTWLTDEHGLTKLNSEEANNLYIIALGINDNRTIGISNIGTISDILSDNIDSFYSYYGRIIRAIQSHAPNSYIMLSTVARLNKDWSGQNYDDFSNAIRVIASHYGYPLLDLSTADLFNSTWFLNNQIRNHPTAVGYSAMANTYEELIKNAMKTNSQYFNGYVGL